MKLGIRNGDREGGTSLFAEDAEIAVLGVEFDAEFAKAFFPRVEKPVVDGNSISAVLNKLLFFVLGRFGR